jgi:PIN domain nuclease of toxin-antitoxin system
MSNLFVLDTHVFIWLMNGEEKLRLSPVLKTLEQSVRSNGVSISAISVWEVAMLEAEGKIAFTVPCLDWIHSALNGAGISLIPLTPEIAVESTRLPGEFLGDAADRIIVAAARKLEAILVTSDEAILNYGRLGFVHVLPLPKNQPIASRQIDFGME